MFVNIASATQFTDYIAHGAVLAVLGSPTCSHCVATKRALKAFAEKYPRITCLFVDVDRMAMLAAQHRLKSLPTLIVYKAGRQLDRTEGEHSLADLECWVLDRCPVTP